MKITIDRFEGKYAICEKEDKGMIEIELKNLPNGVKEGDILHIDNEIITIDEAATKSRKEYIKSLMDKLWE